MIYFIAIIVIAILLRMIQILPYTYNKDYKFSGELNKGILTNNELAFYNKILPIVKKYDYYLFTKIRLADLINTKTYKDFNKIKSKHIDFVITDKETKPILFIELDDKSHLIEKNKQNDIKKNIIFESINGNLIRIKTNEINDKIILIDNILMNKEKR